MRVKSLILFFASIMLVGCSSFRNTMKEPRKEVDDRPLIGVIRWDGYNGSPIWTQQQEFGFLKPEKHHWRAPWFVRRTGDPENPLEFNPEFSQQVIQKVTNQEIVFASDAGIDYWAFCHYAKHKDAANPGWQLRNNLQAYLDSPIKSRINFSLIAIGDHIGAGIGDITPSKTSADWKAYVNEYIELMKEPTYQKVLGDRPLFYIFNPAGLSVNLGDEGVGVQNLRAALEYMRWKVKSAGLGNPYIVGMHHGDIDRADVYIDAAGFDAISCYYPGFGATKKGIAYRELWDNIVTSFLMKHLADGRKIIPPLASGYNQHPRNPEAPFYFEPKSGDFTDAITSAMNFVVQFPEFCEANSILIYAWNEHSEGGFICPTMGDEPDYEPNTYLLDQLADAAKNWVYPEKLRSKR